MSSDDSMSSAGKVTIIVALIGLFGTVLTLVINNWDKIFHTSETTTVVAKPIPDNVTDTAGKVPDQGVVKPSEHNNNPPSPVADYNSAVATITQEWWNDITASKVDDAVSLSATPFLFNSKLLNDIADVKTAYNSFAGNNAVTFNITDVSKVADLIKQGTLQQQSDTLLGNMFMLDSYIANVTTTRNSDNHVEKNMILVKKSGNTLKIVGLADHL